MDDYKSFPVARDTERPMKADAPRRDGKDILMKNPPNVGAQKNPGAQADPHL